jgi:peptidoglycan/LPS O-acetylase OafA/YrhL
MQIFFFVAGFFGAMLFYKRSPKSMMKNRVLRIVFPFLVFVVLLWPTIVFSFSYSRLVFDGDLNAFDHAMGNLYRIESWIPQATFHLWFLYYLALITFASVLLGLVIKMFPKISRAIHKGFNWIIVRPFLRIFFFGAGSAMIYFVMKSYSVETSTSWTPDFNTFIYYFFFYIVGWVLFKSKHLLGTMKMYDWASALIGLSFFSVYFILNDSLGFEAKIVIKSLMVWAFIFGITGLFIRYGSNHSARMRYISDSSYWVYLLHLSLTALIPGLIAKWAIPATFKFLFVMTVSGIICFTTYHYLVRGTFIGKFLNGRKYSRKLSDIRKSEALKQAV